MSERTVSSALPSRGLLLVALALSLGQPACSQRKISECNALITAINNGVLALEKTPRPEPDPSGAAELESLAGAMDRVAQELGAVLVTLPETGSSPPPTKRWRKTSQKPSETWLRRRRSATSRSAPPPSKRWI
jgi:hypothetical protein